MLCSGFADSDEPGFPLYSSLLHALDDGDACPCWPTTPCEDSFTTCQIVRSLLTDPGHQHGVHEGKAKTGLGVWLSQSITFGNLGSLVLSSTRFLFMS